jgi:uncharacterized membrane protein
MLLNSFQFDIFGFINGIFIISLVVVIIFFIIVVLIVYKLFHSNVDNVKKKQEKNIYKTPESTLNISKEPVKQESKIENSINTCEYCGETIEENTPICPYCGWNLES